MIFIYFHIPLRKYSICTQCVCLSCTEQLYKSSRSYCLFTTKMSPSGDGDSPVASDNSDSDDPVQSPPSHVPKPICSLQKSDQVVIFYITFIGGSNDNSNSIRYINRIKRTSGKTAAVLASGPWSVCSGNVIIATHSHTHLIQTAHIPYRKIQLLVLTANYGGFPILRHKQEGGGF